MMEIQLAALTGFVLGLLVGAGIMTMINLSWIRSVMAQALALDLARQRKGGEA